jgi:hypothetical protein
MIHYYGMRKIGVRGKAGAHKVMLLAATAFNLKKYLRFKPVEVVSQAITRQKQQEEIFTANLCPFIAFF